MTERYSTWIVKGRSGRSQVSSNFPVRAKSEGEAVAWAISHGISIIRVWKSDWEKEDHHDRGDREESD